MKKPGSEILGVVEVRSPTSTNATTHVSLVISPTSRADVRGQAYLGEWSADHDESAASEDWRGARLQAQGSPRSERGFSIKQLPICFGASCPAKNTEAALSWVTEIEKARAAAPYVEKPKGVDPKAVPGRARQSVTVPDKFSRRQAERTLQPDRSTSKQLTSQHHEALKAKLKVSSASAERVGIRDLCGVLIAHTGVPEGTRE